MTADRLNERSIVYVLTNPSMPGCVKIGWTSRTAQQRSDELFTTGVAQPFEVAVAYRVPNGVVVERALHLAFEPYRVHAGREFFEVKPSQVEAILKLLGTAAGVEDVTDEVDNNPSLIPQEIIRRSRRPQADFGVMGIPVGTEIVCVRNGATANIASRRTVLFEGEEMSLTAATKRILPDTEGNGAYLRWRYGDEVLMTTYNRCYPRSRAP